MQSKLIESLLMILEKPNVKKGYKEFKNYLESNNNLEAAAAIEFLLETKFANEPDNSNTRQEQQ